VRRITLLTATALVALALIACGDDDEDVRTPNASLFTTTPVPTTPGPTPSPGEWIRYKSFGVCIQFDYPSDWSNVPSDSVLVDTQLCPGGGNASATVACNADAVANAFPVIKLRAPGNDQFPASVEWYLAQNRCESLADHFEQLRANIPALNAGPAADATVGNYAARCADITFESQPENLVSSVCAFEVGPNIYHIFFDAVESRRAEFKPTLDRIAASISVTGVGAYAPTPAAAPSPTTDA
jgi:hypothetical protein